MHDRPDESRFDVVVCGASFAGLALARALSLGLGRGARIALVDRAGPTTPTAADARAFAVSAASRHLLERLGAWPRIASEAQPTRAIALSDTRLEDAVRPTILTYDNAIEAGEPATFVVPAPALQAALAMTVADDDAISWIAPATATGFVATETGVTVALADGRQLAAALLVAADGRKSPLREAAGIKSIAADYDQIGIVTTIAHSRTHEGRAVQHFLPGGPFAILPLVGRRSCITWSERAEEARRILALDDDGFLEELRRRVGGTLGTITLAGPRQSWPLGLHLARRYVAPRFAVVGDAAHVVHPIGGQGVNLAFRDAAALAEIAVDTARLGIDIGNMAALERYERWRRTDATTIAITCDAINRLFSNDSTLLRVVRDAGFALIDRSETFKAGVVARGAGLSGELPRLLRGEPL